MLISEFVLVRWEFCYLVSVSSLDIQRVCWLKVDCCTRLLCWWVQGECLLLLVEESVNVMERLFERSPGGMNRASENYPWCSLPGVSLRIWFWGIRESARHTGRLLAILEGPVVEHEVSTWVGLGQNNKVGREKQGGMFCGSQRRCREGLYGSCSWYSLSLIRADLRTGSGETENREGLQAAFLSSASDISPRPLLGIIKMPYKVSYFTGWHRSHWIKKKLSHSIFT